MQLVLPQTATYWEASNDTDRYGNKTFSAPVQVPCRWEDRVQTVMSKRGEEFTSKARVFFASDKSLDGYLYLGVSSDPDPTGLDDVYEIQAKTTTPDLRGLQSLTTVYL
jgi:hypothetical protein